MNMTENLDYALPEISAAVKKSNRENVKELLQEAKIANKVASKIPIIEASYLGKTDVLVRLQRNAAALSMTLDIVQDIYVNMNSEIGELHAALKKEYKQKNKRMEKLLRVQRNQRYVNKKGQKAEKAVSTNK